MPVLGEVQFQTFAPWLLIRLIVAPEGKVKVMKSASGLRMFLFGITSFRLNFPNELQLKLIILSSSALAFVQ